MDYVKALEGLISIDNTAPPGRNYGQTIDYLTPLFREFGFETVRVDIPPEHAENQEGRVNLVAHRPQPGKPRLIFYAHIDVVPARGWDAFRPRVEGGKIYGRGSADMKGSIVGLLGALEQVKDEPLRYDTSVMITTDEEVSQASQLEYLKSWLEPVAGAYFFNLDASAGFAGIAGLGALQVVVRVKGKSVHSAMAHLGENAIEKSVPLLQALLDLKGRLGRKKSAVDVNPDTGLTKMIPRLNINMIEGGIKVNIIPDECRISVDRRLIPEENMEDAREELMAALGSVPDVEWETGSTFMIPTVPPCRAPLVDELAGIIRDVTGKTGKYGEMGSGDLAHIVAGWGGQVFSLGVIRADNRIHGIDEFVYLKDIEDLAEVIRRFLTAEG